MLGQTESGFLMRARWALEIYSIVPTGECASGPPKSEISKHSGEWLWQSRSKAIGNQARPHPHHTPPPGPKACYAPANLKVGQGGSRRFREERAPDNFATANVRNKPHSEVYPIAYPDPAHWDPSLRLFLFLPIENALFHHPSQRAPSQRSHHKPRPAETIGGSCGGGKGGFQAAASGPESLQTLISTEVSRRSRDPSPS